MTRGVNIVSVTNFKIVDGSQGILRYVTSSFLLSKARFSMLWRISSQTSFYIEFTENFTPPPPRTSISAKNDWVGLILVGWSKYIELINYWPKYGGDYVFLFLGVTTFFVSEILSNVVFEVFVQRSTGSRKAWRTAFKTALLCRCLYN